MFLRDICPVVSTQALVHNQEKAKHASSSGPEGSQSGGRPAPVERGKSTSDCRGSPSDAERRFVFALIRNSRPAVKLQPTVVLLCVCFHPGLWGGMIF